MARKTTVKSLADARADLKAAQERVARFEAKEAERIGKIWLREGWPDPNEKTVEAVNKLFRDGGAVKSQAASAERSGAGTPSVAHE